MRSAGSTARILLTLAAVIGVTGGPLLAPVFEDCTGVGDYWQYEGSYTVHTLVCTGDEDWGPLASCALGSESYDTYSCQHPAPPSNPGPPGPSSGPGPSDPPLPANPKDTNNDGKIDCWKQTVDTSEANKTLGPSQTLGTCLGGTNTSLNPDGTPDVDRSCCHSGIDIDCIEGEPIYAAATGTITYRGDNGDGFGGIQVWITAGVYGDFRYDSLHMLRVADGIDPGDPVRVGDLIGYCGRTGGANTDHSHLRILKPDGTPHTQCPEVHGKAVFDPQTAFPCPP